ncbi:unnamed protein product [Pieris macdunnoughi]|uniref:Uncharacterized protein n=1 Tax=Pieris macdunnoughi TaxID=345717 RepID=A0A821W6H3_9NEOP|nr:unnamed protein product [Pieris macdunnoughi]
MFACKRCEIEARDGATCSVCAGQFDFPCAGITEGGWRKLGERKSTWKCSSCKSRGIASPKPTVSSDPDSIVVELKRLSSQMEAIPALVDSVRAIQAELVEFRTIREEFSDMKASIEFVHNTVEALTLKVSTLEQEIDSLVKTKGDLLTLQDRVNNLEELQNHNEQRLRMNNIEIKGVPESSAENLFNILDKLGTAINCKIQKEQVNYIARVPTRNNKHNNNIICSVQNSYLKNEFVAAAKNHKALKAVDLGLRCKIFIRKNTSSPKHHINTERDLKKFFT